MTAKWGDVRAAVSEILRDRRRRYLPNKAYPAGGADLWGGKGAWVERVCVPSRSIAVPSTHALILIRVLDRTGTARLRLAAAPRTSQHRESQHVPF